MKYKKSSAKNKITKKKHSSARFDWSMSPSCLHSKYNLMFQSHWCSETWLLGSRAVFDVKRIQQSCKFSHRFRFPNMAFTELTQPIKV